MQARRQTNSYVNSHGESGHPGDVGPRTVLNASILNPDFFIANKRHALCCGAAKRGRSPSPCAEEAKPPPQNCLLTPAGGWCLGGSLYLGQTVLGMSPRWLRGAGLPLRPPPPSPVGQRQLHSSGEDCSIPQRHQGATGSWGFLKCKMPLSTATAAHKAF